MNIAATTHISPLTLARFLASACLALALMIPTAGWAQNQSSITINIPKRPGAKATGDPTATQLEISAVKISLLLTDDAALGLTVKWPTVASPLNSMVTNAMNLTIVNDDCFAGNTCSQIGASPGGGLAEDSLVITKPLNVAADPGASSDTPIVVLTLFLDSNINGSCGSTMAANETVTISVNGGLARIKGVAVQTLDRDLTTTDPPACGTNFRATPLNQDPIATVTAPATVITGRVGTDAILVLDRSGSMSGRTNPMDAGSPIKMVRLHSAAGMFLDLWKDLRDAETAALTQVTTDRLGVIFFDHNINWLSEVSASTINGLKDFSTLDIPTVKTHINSVMASGATSIGGGVKKAGEALPSAGSETNRKVILLMSDGKHNTAPNPSVNLVAKQVQVDGSNLANQPPLKIYSLTVGVDAAIDPTLNQDMATATGGFYLNSEVDDSLLNSFFLTVLQNFVRFSTVETLRLITDTTRTASPFTTQVPVTTTTTRLAFGLNWRASLGRLRIRLTPPNGAPPLVFDAGGPGTITRALNLPLQTGGNAGGLWNIAIEPLGGSDVGTPGATIPFTFILLGDDAALNSSLGVVRAEHAVGGRIKLTARVNDAGAALKNIPSQSGGRVQAFIVRPGNNLGDVLSDSNVAPAPALPNDPGSAAQGKLDALLAVNPDALVRSSGAIPLVDDGSSANGDASAGDGEYSALVPADFEGHYQIVFLVEGVSKSGGRFIRQQVRTVHARSLPDPNATQYTTNVVQLASGSVLVVTMTPRNVRNGKMGPGWANYFWFNPPSGPPVKPVDNLNGTYTAQIPFTGSTPPAVGVHFLPEPAFRPDSFVPAPGQLTPGNQITPNVTTAAGGKWAVWAGLGAAFPFGSFSNDNKTGFAGNIGLEYSITPTASVEGTIGWHQFPGKNAAPDVDVTQFGINGKWYFPQPNFKPFVTLGAGGYAFDPGSTRFGGYAGVGAQFDVAPRVSVEGRFTYHGIAGNSPNSSYGTLLLGLRYSF